MRYVALTVISLALGAAAGGTGMAAETQRTPVEAFADALRRDLGERAGPCAASKGFLSLESQRYNWERRERREPQHPRDVVCFTYRGRLKDFKSELGHFIEAEPVWDVHVLGRWHYDEWFPAPDEGWSRGREVARLYGKTRAVNRLQLEITGVRSEVIFEEGSGTIGIWYERK